MPIPELGNVNDNSSGQDSCWSIAGSQSLSLADLPLNSWAGLHSVNGSDVSRCTLSAWFYALADLDMIATKAGMDQESARPFRLMACSRLDLRPPEPGVHPPRVRRALAKRPLSGPLPRLSVQRVQTSEREDADYVALCDSDG